jgi:hypothetical protein
VSTTKDVTAGLAAGKKGGKKYKATPACAAAAAGARLLRLHVPVRGVLASPLPACAAAGPCGAGSLCCCALTWHSPKGKSHRTPRFLFLWLCSTGVHVHVHVHVHWGAV